MSRRILITGVSGMLGSNLAWAWRDKYSVSGLFHSHPVGFSGVEAHEQDLLDYPSLRKLMLAMQPDTVVHCAAATNVDQQEADAEYAWRTNVQATRNLVDSLRDIPCRLVHISTDAVYPGSGGPHREDGPVGPVNIYGKTKLQAEEIALAHPGALVLRTTIYGWSLQPGKHSLGQFFLKRLKEGLPAPGFVDVQFSAMYSMDLAEIIDRAVTKGLSGVFNAACRDSQTKYAFGSAIARHAGASATLVVEERLQDRRSFSAARSHDMRLSTARLEEKLERPMPSMEESLEHFLSDGTQGVPEALRASSAGYVSVFYPHRDIIGYGCQAVDEKDIATVAQVLKGSHLTQGPAVEAFERAVAKAVDAAHGVAVCNGTAALHVACLAAGVEPGHEVVTSPITFAASANCAAYCGARPVFSDIDPRTGNMSPDSLGRTITNKTRAVIPVHFAGQSCDMQAINAIVREKEKEFGTRIFIIEDACHALGSLHCKEPVGGCRLSDMAVHSFHPVKHITTGEGGMVTTNDPELAYLLQVFRSHGIHRDRTKMSHDPGPWFYEQAFLGYNYRITDVQCALGLSQMDKLPWFKARRRVLVEHYNNALADIPWLEIPYEAPENDSNFHLYVARIDFDVLGMPRKDLMPWLLKQKIQTQVHYIPVHMHLYYRQQYGYAQGNFPKAEAFYERCLSLPLHPQMSDAEQEHVVAAFRSLC